MNNNGTIWILAAALALAASGCSTVSKNEAPPAQAAPAEAPVAPAPAPAEAPAARPAKITLEGVFFDHDRHTLKPEGAPTLDHAASVIKQFPGTKFDISGHTDSNGSDAYNQDLSKRRVNTVRDELVRRGVPAAQLVTGYHGESQPIATNATAEGRAKNRRVEIVPVD
ncbi:MAG: OmpA family protein [Gammaproteobacteria bacterium]